MGLHIPYQTTFFPLLLFLLLSFWNYFWSFEKFGWLVFYTSWLTNPFSRLIAFVEALDQKAKDAVGLSQFCLLTRSSVDKLLLINPAFQLFYSASNSAPGAVRLWLSYRQATFSNHLAQLQSVTAVTQMSAYLSCLFMQQRIQFTLFFKTHI